VSGQDLHQLLGAYLLGGLQPDEAAAFERHLAECRDCRAELDQLASLPALLDAVPVPDAIALTAAVRAGALDTAADPAPAASAAAPIPAPVPAPVPRGLLAALAARRRRSRLLWSAGLAAVTAPRR
jgi:anti-sigma factor RsiW